MLTEISLLKTQVNPHFLFNSLSILSSLVRVDPDLSEKFIDQLSRSYRYILEQKDQTVVTLRTELSFIPEFLPRNFPLTGKRRLLRISKLRKLPMKRDSASTPGTI